MGSKYLSGGVYNERLAGGAMPVPGISTATYVVAGAYADGPDTKVEILTSWSEFERKYGGLSTLSDSGYAIKAFFENGGRRVVPFRVINGAVAASATTPFTGWTISAQYKSAVYNNWTVVLAANEDTTSNYDVTVKNSDGEEVEKYVSVNFTDANSADYVTNKVNNYSSYITWSGTGAVSAGGTATLSGGTAGSTLSASDIISAFTVGNCLLDSIISENLIISCPDFQVATVTNQMITYAEARGDCFVLFGGQTTDDTPAKAITYRKTVSTSQKAAMYWPNVKVYDVLRKAKRAISPVGHVAGIFARTDATKNVGKNPAGVVDGALRGLVELSYNTKLGERDSLYQGRVNPLINEQATGMAVWGCRTTSLDPEWIYINHERLFQFIEKALNQATTWVVFENNTDTTRLRLYSQVYGALKAWHDENYFAGATAEESFFVVCDRTNNPEYVVSSGELLCDVGIAPGKPSEFVRIRIRQKTLSK